MMELFGRGRWIDDRVLHWRSAGMERTMSSGALGIKVKVSGRLGGLEIARKEWMREGRIPLHTFCADIDYGFTEAMTTMGKIGVKVWIFKKLLFAKTPRELMEELRKSGPGEEPETDANAQTSEIPKAPKLP